MPFSNTLFINHFHTEKSTEYVREITEEPEWKGINHLGDPMKILKKLDEGQNAVIVLTEHYRTNGEKFFEKLGEDVEEIGGDYELNDRSLMMEHERSKVAIINGVEASYKRRDTHIVIAGLPIEDEEEYYNLDIEELSRVLEDAAYAHPAHPFLGDFGMDMEELDEVCETIKDSPTKLFIPYTYAYPFNIDRNARGETDSEIDVRELAERYGAPLIVEHDHHVHLPSSLGGIGLLNDRAINELEEGRVPVDEIKDMRIIQPTKLDTFRDLFRAGRTFADQLPNYIEWERFWKILTFPYGREDMEELRDKYYAAELNDLDMEELRARSRRLN
jgi:hypothetical protein